MRENFIKYPEIEQIYNKKIINKYLSYFPELENETFILQEKIDGANFQIFIDENNEIYFGKRSCFLNEEAKFYDFQNVMETKKHLIEILKGIKSVKNAKTIRAYGELFSGSIQKRIDYKKEKDFILYDLLIDDIYLSPKELNELIPESYIVKSFAIVKGLTNAFEYDIEKLNTFYHEEGYKATGNTQVEGIVIKPFNKVYTKSKNSNSPLYFKKKNDKFKEHTNEKIYTQEELEQRNKNEIIFGNIKNFINENRMLSYFSKEGEIEDIKQMGKYIIGISEDIFKDYNKLYDDFIKLDKNSQSSIIKKVNASIAILLKNFLIG